MKKSHMMSENLKTDRAFEQLGLPPMELAESSANVSGRSNIVTYKCLFWAVQKVTIILLLATFGVGTYILFTNLLENSISDSSRNTEIILVASNGATPNVTFQDLEIFFQLKDRNKTSAIGTNKTRKKRQTGPPPGTTLEVEDPFLNFSDEDLQKAREIIMKHDMLCNDENQQEICKDLVLKLKALSENSRAPKKNEDISKVSFKTIHNDQNAESSQHNSPKDLPDVLKREVFPMTSLDSIIESIPGISVDARDVSPYANPSMLPHLHPGAPPLTDSCLLARLLKHNYPQAHEIYDPGPEHLVPHPLLPQSRYYAPLLHSYLQTRETGGQRRKIHPQDIDIFMSFLTQKPELLADKVNSSIRDVDCQSGTIPCFNSDLCIDEKLWCDGNVDCPDVSDESMCTCKSRVDTARLCDGYFDCPFGEDEMECHGCKENTFSCEDLDVNSRSTCFTKEQRCNNVVDCPNHKDEVECNMLAPSLHKKPMFAISNTEGFLHRNFKGDWYAVCKNPYMWAHDACRRETGLIIRPPFIQILPIDPMQKINYLNTGPGGLLQTSDTCLNSSAVYVTCPDLLCGTRVQSTTQMLRENAAVENHLFGRNKRFLLTNHPYPLMFYGNRMKRNVHNSSIKTDYDIKLSTLKGFDKTFDKTRDKRAESRVVGGKPSEPAAWPWMVAVYRNGMFHCGGVVFTHSWVISAAHCVHKFWDHYYEVQVGMLRRFSFSPQEQSHKVTHVIVNQHYSKTDMKNDLSLLKVEPAIQFSRWVRPVCLPGPDTAGPDWLWGPAPGTICTAVGWGATVEHGPDPDHMREVEMPIWENCKHLEDRSGKEICAGFVEGGKDACQGDSGGPLLCRNPLNSQQWYMAGIVSHGDGCGRKDEPGVYTRVSLFVKWIKYHISSNSLPIVQPIQECPGFKCESGISKCLPNKRQCDKIIDCLDGEDEMNCDLKRSVPMFTNDKPLPSENKISENILSRATQLVATVLPRENRENPISTTEITHIEENFTAQEDITTTFTTTEGVNFKFPENSSHRLITDNTMQPQIDPHTENYKNESNPDFAHASTLELASPTSTEIFGSYSHEHVTSDPVKTTNAHTTASRGDAETIMMEFAGESLESRSSVLEKNKHEVINNVDIHSTTITTSLPTETSTLIYTTNYITETQETTTRHAFQENNTLLELRTHEKEAAKQRENSQQPTYGDRNEKKTEGLVELVPDSHTLSNQMNIETNHEHRKHNFHIDDKDSSSSSHNGSSKKIFDFEDNSEMFHKIEDIISSELQPAKVRRKHRVPKEFECRRIYQIVPYDHRCDRKADCEDGTDELGCTCIDYLSTFDLNLICDGMFDCADGQDEIDCYSCSDDRFLCKRSQICLPIKHVCDGKPQCPQGEDELDCFALTNGKEIEYDVDETPKINLEGYLTKKHFKDWHVVCDDKLSIDQQEQAATHICHYLGFSSANRYYVKYINLKEDEIAKHSVDNTRRKRQAKESVPVHFAYRQTNKDNHDTARHTVMKEPQLIKEECVPNITKTCKSLYVFCEHSLFTNFDDAQNLFTRDTESVSYHMWPWAAKVYVEGEYSCTGVLVNLSWVLISDSCLWDSTLASHFITVALGSHRTIGSISGMYEQVYQVDAKKDIYRSKAILLHLKKPSHYSNLVKPMVISSSFIHLEDKSNCVAVGQDNNSNTVSVFLNETSGNCHSSNRCFVRKTQENICPSGVSLNRHWAGIVNCHTDQGWFPAASFVDSRGECGLADRINGTDIENLKNEIKYYSGKKTLQSSGEQDFSDDCEGARCGRGRCIPLSHTCDGIRHCEDGNDESEQACDKKSRMCTEDPYHKGCECSVGQMKCRNGKCVSKEFFKDGNDDCGDGTDEPVQTTCSDYMARVMPSRLCDGVLHCHDRSDEDPMFCKCFAERTFKCDTKSADAEHCVAPDMVCDGIRDCPNGKDEHTCIALNAPQGTPYGTGQVIVRSHGVWHSKCYPTQNHTKTELEDICRELGYIGGHAKEIKDMEKLVIHPHNNLVIAPFNDVVLNNNTVIKMRNTHEPIAKAVFDDNLQNCYPVFIECL